MWVVGCVQGGKEMHVSARASALCLFSTILGSAGPLPTLHRELASMVEECIMVFLVHALVWLLASASTLSHDRLH